MGSMANDSFSLHCHFDEVVFVDIFPENPIKRIVSRILREDIHNIQ